VGLHDDKSAARAIAVERLEVRVPGRHGGTRWEPLAARLAAAEPGPCPEPVPAAEPTPDALPDAAPGQLFLSLDFAGGREP
jgi:hypothetical protein